MAQISGLDPSVIVAPDYQVQMQRAQRQAALAQALRSQALQDTPGNGGSVSWSQGLARLADALAANISNKRSEKTQMGANQNYAAGMARLFGMPAPQSAPQMPQGAPPAPQGSPAPQMPPQPPQQAPALPPGTPPAPGQTDPLAPLPDQSQVAPPQAASPPPMPAAAPPPGQSPSGGANYPMNLTGDPRKDFMLYMENPDEFSKAQIANAAKGGAPTDTEVLVSHAQQALARGDVATATALLGNLQKQNFIPPTSFRPGGWSQDASGKMSYHPQAPAPGAMPVLGADGQPTGAWTDDPSAAKIQAQQAGAVAGAQSAAKAPYDTIQTFNPATGQMEIRPKSDVTGGGSLNSYYGAGPGAAPGHSMPAGPGLGQQEAFGQYGKHSADAFDYTQGIARESPQRVQALREMSSLVANGMPTGPTAAKLQQMAEEHGLTFLAKDNAFVFNKDAARFVAQSASDLGLNGSDARLGMMANASPNMKMTPPALKTVIPTMIGLEYAKMAKATAAAHAAQTNPAGNAQFESSWRQAYDPRMFTAYAQGGPQALAQAPANLRQQWLKDYRTLKGMGVDFTQFAQ